MATTRFSIGIDLGTTNSALAYVPLAGDAQPEVLLVSQWETPNTLIEASTLPSFLYLPDEALAGQLRGKVPGTAAWIVGRLARRGAGESPGRVVRSAKSWLCHHAADRFAPILPWGSEDLASAQKISPIFASALILRYLRGTWNSTFPDDPFDAQEITITVPASFDAAAQRLTLDAAAEAGFPNNVRLLEEPQAAFYCWLAQHDMAHLWEGSTGQNRDSRDILIIDIGGGTTDFSLFNLRSRAAGTIPDITRVAVSDHILLGGDNIDLALAAMLEPRLVAERGRISGPQWEYLVAACRDLKEKALAGSEAGNDRFTVALPGRGSRLVAGAQTAILGGEEVARLVLEGFFPTCDARARPYRTQSALRDWGLPYAADSAVTHHLAEFLADRPQVDAVLFNGGSLRSAAMRQRLLNQIAAWQGVVQPVELENAEPDLAVARGAARYGRLLHGELGRIAAGAASAVFLEVQRTENATIPPDLICVLPRNASAEQTFEINLPGLEVRTDQLVSFQACSSTRHDRCRAGDIVQGESGAFHALPPLQTIIRTTEGAEPGTDRTVPVRLAVKLNALGLVQLACISADPREHRSWPLEFNLRPQERSSDGPGGHPAAAPVAPNATAEAQQAAQQHITSLFTRPARASGKLTANGVVKHLEGVLGLSRHEWNAALLRTIWPVLHQQMPGRKLSVEHEETWLTLAGFLLRPGFGFAHDALRMQELWQLRKAGLCYPGRRSKVQEYILWRRVAGGLTGEQQEMLLSAEIESIRRARASPELLRLVGSLERLPRGTKSELVETFIAQTLACVETKQHCAPYLAALGLLLNRSPAYAGPETVVMPDLVERAYAAFQDLDWTEPELLELQTLFLRAARVVGDRNFDVAKSVRDRIATKLEHAGVVARRTAVVRAFAPVGRMERAPLYGEALPPGLVLSEFGQYS
ncbi:MAG TPA: Hsp70 family protein [Acetobacteraceae bacterium]|nr:Hsp70 family protein [Acetobacteraceae bacterium]